MSLSNSLKGIPEMEKLHIPYASASVIPCRQALVFAPHPDDEVFGCGGAIARHVEQRVPVQVIIVTDGASATSDSVSDVVTMREAESRAAAKVLGYGEPIFWRLPDRGLEFGEELVERVRGAVVACGADLVYSPSLREVHPDHRVLAMAVIEALRRLGGGLRVAFYEVGTPLAPNLLLDISDLISIKGEAMSCFISQLAIQRYDQHIVALNRYRTYTLSSDVAAAEAFFLVEGSALETCWLDLYEPEFLRQHRLGLPASPKDLPLVSIIVRTLGRPTLSEALDSIALQTYPHVEVVMVNAGASEIGVEGDRCGRFPLRMVGDGSLLPRSSAANAGLLAAHGDYLMFLDDDDWIDPGHVAGLLLSLRDQHGFRAAYSGVRTVDDHRQASGMVFNRPYDHLLLLAGNYLPIHGVMFDRRLVSEAGCRFDPDFEIYEDWDFWLQLARHTAFHHVEAVTANYRIASGSGFGVHAPNRVQEEGKRRVYRKWRNTCSDDEWFEVLTRVYELGLVQVDRDRVKADLKQALHSRAAEAQEIVRLQATLQGVYGSRSWRVTAPLRVLKRYFADGAVKAAISPERSLVQYVKLARKGARISGGWLPLMRRVVGHLSSGGVPQLRRSAATLRERLDAPTAGELYEPMQEASSAHPLHFRPPDQEVLPRGDCAVDLIAFYLPQFHPIPENDAWWGKGFTEWTNVSKAQPQFVGHYQPRFPGELGYYDLRVPAILRRQVELARQYGIQGFCFHYYWFGGRQLLELPLNMFLADGGLDFPFCICWANENWTRRWDGLEQDVLIGQQHSSQDDLAFIEALIPMFRDSRYIRIGGKPLLIVYRPALLPDARATSQRWREACRRAGIGEIYLTMAQCFNDNDPHIHGFDAAVEFPPHHVAVGEHAIKPYDQPLSKINPNFQGAVFNYAALLDRQRRAIWPSYALFKTVFPSWDNEARKKGTGHVFHCSTPDLYRTWLSDCCRSALDHPVEGKSIVFVNAWNEWAEGAYLEPDRRYGYAYLAATRDVVREFSRSKAEILKSTQHFDRTADTAIILHLFYPELWPEIFSRLKNIDGGYDLYVSLSPYADRSAAAAILTDAPDARLFQFDNIGRDIYPFLELFRSVAPLGYRWICKIHSKKSRHREGGDTWRRAMLDGLLGSADLIRKAIALLESGQAGIVAAPGQIFRSPEYWGSNLERVTELLSNIGVEIETQPLDFVAGTMFWCVPEALAHLLEVDVADGFEPECGQIDGTLAHALERFISIGARARGYQVVELE